MFFLAVVVLWLSVSVLAFYVSYRIASWVRDRYDL